MTLRSFAMNNLFTDVERATQVCIVQYGCYYCKKDAAKFKCKLCNLGYFTLEDLSLYFLYVSKHLDACGTSSVTWPKLAWP